MNTDKLQIFSCTFDIYVGDNYKRQTIKAPRFILEQDFLGYVEEAANTAIPIKIKMSRINTVWNHFEQRYMNQEQSIIFANNAYMNIHNQL